MRGEERGLTVLNYTKVDPTKGTPPQDQRVLGTDKVTVRRPLLCYLLTFKVNGSNALDRVRQRKVSTYKKPQPAAQSVWAEWDCCDILGDNESQNGDCQSCLFPN